LTHLKKIEYSEIVIQQIFLAMSFNWWKSSCIHQALSFPLWS